MFPSFIASAPGKIILSGEHSVVHGTRAIATVVDKRTYITFSPNQLPPVHPNTIIPQCDVSLTADYDEHVLIHQWSQDSLLQHKATLLQAYMTKIKDYTPCDHEEHHDHNHGIGDAHHQHEAKAYFTTEQKLTDYIQDHTYPNRHLHHKHHGTLNQLTDIFDELYSGITVNVVKVSKSDGVITQVDPTTLHPNIEICPAKVFLLYYYLLLLTSTPVTDYVTTSGKIPTLHASIISHLPMGAGLGSSASVTSALSGGYYQILRYFPSPSNPEDVTKVLTGADKQVINTWAFQGERVIHGTPSGVDNTCTVYGGVIAFRRVNGLPEMEFLPSGCLPSTIKIFITNTRQPKNTKALVEGVHALKKSYQFVVEPIFTSIEQITQVLLDNIRKYVDREQTFMTDDDLFDILRAIIPINQSLLDALGVGHAKINEVLSISGKFGGNMVTKLTGAGGGGCVISITKPNVNQEVIAKFEEAIVENKMETFGTVMGQAGVTIEAVSK